MSELFANVEINRTPRAPRLLRVLGVSALLHLSFVAALIYVPTVRAMFQLAGMFASADYVDEAYTTADVRERATLINLTDTKFYYPAGYFTSTAPPAGVATSAPPSSPDDPKLIAEVRPEQLNLQAKSRPTPRPRATPSPTASPTPDASATPSAEAATIAQNNANPSPTPTPDIPKTEDEVNKVAEQAKVQRFPKINKRPFVELVAKGKKLKDAGAINLDGEIDMTVEADRNDDGTLGNIVVTSGATSNRELKNLAIEFVQALSASKALSVLQDAKHLRISLRLDEQAINAKVATEVASAARANELANVYSGMIFVERVRRGGDDAQIFSNMKISTEDKQVVVKFQMSRQTAGDLLKKQIASS